MSISSANSKVQDPKYKMEATDETRMKHGKKLSVSSVFHPWLNGLSNLRNRNLAQRILNWARSHPWTLLAILILLIHAVPFLLKHHSEWDEVYLRAAGRLLHGGDVYRYEDGYSYPPFMAWLAIPFTGLPVTVSRVLWLGINIGCLIGIWRLAWRLSGGGTLEGNKVTQLSEHLICFLGVACSVRYALNGIAHHQTDLVIGLLLLGGCGLLSIRRDWSAASFFGLAAAMKCTALLWCPYLIWKKKWKDAVWMAVLAIGVNLLPNLVRAPEGGGLWLKEWLTRYIHPLTAANHYPGDWGSWIIYNQSIAGAGNRWLTTERSWRESKPEVIRKTDAAGPLVVKSFVYGAETILLIGAAIVLNRRRARTEGQGTMNQQLGEILEYSLVLLLMVLLSPMSSKPHFSTLVLPGFALARLAVYGKDKSLQYLLGLAMVIAALSLPLWGKQVDFVALWLGSDMWNAAILLVCCSYALWNIGSAKILQPQSIVSFPQAA
jgi:hypothetical protein